MRNLAAIRREFRREGDILAMQLEAIQDYILEFQALVKGDVEVELAVRKPRVPKVSGGIAVIPIHGAIMQRGGDLQQMFGGTSTEQLGRTFDAAMASDQIGAVLFDVDSPGGGVKGVSEVTDKIFAARGRKPIVAIANGLAASAAFWIASAADQLIVTPSGDVGSVGVFTQHEDCSKMLEEMGVQTTLISAGEFKVEGNPFEPLSDDAREHLQERVDEIYEEFVSVLSKNRGVSRKVVMNDFGRGRVVRGDKAVAAGMADRVETFEQLLRRMGTGTTARAIGTRMQQDADEQLTAELAEAWDGEVSLTADDEGHGKPEILRKKLELREKQEVRHSEGQKPSGPR